MTSTKKRVLVIEDEKPMAHALALKLEHEGFEAETAENGEVGLQKIVISNYAMILCDLVMPKMDGFQVLTALQEKKNKTPVIVLSNLGQEEDAKRAIALGARSIFVKSNTPISSIVEKIKAELG